MRGLIETDHVAEIDRGRWAGRKDAQHNLVWWERAMHSGLIRTGMQRPAGQPPSIGNYNQPGRLLASNAID
jgi:hypothetical protein